MSAEQGYLFIAFGPDRYLHMAAACVLSLRRGDPHRPCQLVCDRDDLGAYAPLFQVVTRAHEQGDFRGPLAKLRAYEYSQFEATMFVDCDCLCVGRWMDEEWRLVQGRDFTLPGNAVAKGKWYEQDVRSLCERFAIPHVVQMNSGTFYFRKSAAARAVFTRCLELYRSDGNFTGHVHRNVGAPDEPFLGVALAQLKMEPVAPVRPDGRSWMISTLKSEAFELDFLDGTSRFVKGGRPVAPAITHFVGTRPHDLYLREINKLRGGAGFEALAAL